MQIVAVFYIDCCVLHDILDFITLLDLPASFMITKYVFIIIIITKVLI